MLAAIALLACLIAGIVPASAQTTASHTTWADVAKWPDFTTGTWDEPPPPVNAPPPEAAGRANAVLQAPLTPAFAARVKAALKFQSRGGSGATSCEPAGVVVDSGTEFYFGKDVIIITGTSNSSNILRRIHLDRAVHGDPEPSYFGDSIGHWEGNTLVIDTIAIRAEAQIVPGAPLNSTATHMIERYRLEGPNTLELTKTVENPELFTKPWTTTKIMHRLLGVDQIESYCWNDREADSATQAPDLTPPQ